MSAPIANATSSCYHATNHDIHYRCCLVHSKVVTSAERRSAGDIRSSVPHIPKDETSHEGRGGDGGNSGFQTSLNAQTSSYHMTPTKAHESSSRNASSDGNRVILHSSTYQLGASARSGGARPAQPRRAHHAAPESVRIAINGSRCEDASHRNVLN